MESIKSKNSNFIERWSNAEIINAKIGVVLMVMSGLCFALTASVIYMMIKPRPIYYVPGVPSAGVAFPQVNPQATASIFSAAWILNWSNFTPATVDEVYKHAQRFMSPHLLNQTKTRLKKDVEQVKSNNVSSMFSINQDPTVREDFEGFYVSIRGDKGIYMGKEEIKTQEVIYRLRLRATPSTDWNPYGLVIEDISQEIVG